MNSKEALVPYKILVERLDRSGDANTFFVPEKVGDHIVTQFNKACNEEHLPFVATGFLFGMETDTLLEEMLMSARAQVARKAGE